MSKTTSLNINGIARPLPENVKVESSLLDFLRNKLGLTGTRFGCGLEQCGACMVLVDGAPVQSCNAALDSVVGKQITTVEGLRGTDGELHPLQQAFLEEAALQCGICTPGFLVAAKGLLDREPHPDEHRIRLWLAGNLCRCTGYDTIVKSIAEAARRMATA